MTSQFRDAYEATEYELQTIAGLSIALTDLLAEYDKTNCPEGLAVQSVAATLRDKANAVLELHEAEWSVVQSQKNQLAKGTGQGASGTQKSVPDKAA